MRIWISITLVLSIFLNIANGQTKTATVSISGLTCSQCSRSVEMQLKKLSFIQSIQMDLKATNAKIIIKKGEKTDFIAIAKAVTNAGFSVAGLDATLNLAPKDVPKNGCFTTVDGKFFVINMPIKNDNSEQLKISFVGKPFTKEKVAISKLSETCQTSAQYIVKAY